MGKSVLSRMFDVFGNVIDRGPALAEVQWRSVHHAPPPLARRSTKSEIFETGIEVNDVLVPLERGGKAGLFGGAGVGKTVLLTEMRCTKQSCCQACVHPYIVSVMDAGQLDGGQEYLLMGYADGLACDAWLSHSGKSSYGARRSIGVALGTAPSKRAAKRPLRPRSQRAKPRPFVPAAEALLRDETRESETSRSTRTRNEDLGRTMYTSTPLHNETSGTRFHSDEQRLASFARAIDAVRDQVETQLGAEDSAHLRRINRLSVALEIAGRTFIHFSFEPLGFLLGVGALSAHKSLELMEIGHMALHGCYDSLEGAERFRMKTFRWKAPIDEVSWRTGHNIKHHQYTNIEGRDPDLDFGLLRLSARVPYRRLYALQPVTNILSGFAFTTAINLHVTGMLDICSFRAEPNMLRDLQPATARAQKRKFTAKVLRYYGREYGFFPMLAGPFFLKTLLGNALSEMIRDVHSASIVYCGHVGAKDYAHGTHANGRPQWYEMQVEAARNVRVSHAVSVLCGALDRQIEHHLFPRMPPNRLREIAPQVKAICEAHGVRYLESTWSNALMEVLRELRRLAKRGAALAVGRHALS